MKKFLKVLLIIIGSFFSLFVILALVAYLTDNNDEKSTTLMKIEKTLERVDNREKFEICFTQIKEIAEGKTEDTTRARELLSDKEDYEMWMTQRENEKRVDIAKDTYPDFFLTFNGSYYKVNQAIKRRLNDPDSFDHEETKWDYCDGYRYIKVYVKYRAKNAYGGVITCLAIVNVNIEGEVFEIERLQ